MKVAYCTGFWCMNIGNGFFSLGVEYKSKLNIEATKEAMRKWLKANYWLGWSEMQYKGVKPCILVEKYLGGDDGSLPVDYKFYCMNGKATSVMVCEDRDGVHLIKIILRNNIAQNPEPFQRLIGSKRFRVSVFSLLKLPLLSVQPPYSNYTSLAPAGILSSRMTRFSLSPRSADRSMPQLSWPIILRGARLVTATKVLPTSSSG